MKLEWIVMTTLGLVGAESKASGATLNVHVYDYANLEPAELARFLSLTKEVLASAGVVVEVRLCRGASPIQDCTAREPRTLTVRVAPGYSVLAKNLRREPLGQSFADSGGGAFATVFVGPAKDQALAANIPWLSVLSYAAAHEIGHLLLGARAHTARGLMKEKWDRSDCLALYQGRMHFAPEQAEALAARYANPDKGSVSRAER
jgi:hypothetical protein